MFMEKLISPWKFLSFCLIFVEVQLELMFESLLLEI